MTADVIGVEARLPAAARVETVTADRATTRSATQVVARVWVPAVIAGLALWVVAYGVLFSGLVEHRAQHVLYAKLRQELAAATAPPVHTAQPGDPVASLSIPSLGLSGVVVVEGTSSRNLQRGPGHLPGTALPGQPGVSFLEGKGATYGAPFADIGRLRSGAELTVVTGQGTFRYHVLDVRVAGDPVPALTAPRLVLVSSAGSGWRDGWAPTRAVYVDAALDTPAAVATTTGVPTTSDQTMANDPSALVPLFLWLLALAVSGIVAALAVIRGLGRLAWLVGVPVALACLWGATGAVFGLVPNVV